MQKFCRLVLAVLLAVAANAWSQDYPGKPIKLVIPSPPGGGTDTLGRLVGDKLQARWGQPVIVENRAGGGGNIAGDAVYKATPDGHTLLFAHPAPLVINKLLYKKLTYDPDLFVPVSLVATVPNVLIVGQKVAATNLEQLIAYAKANPDRLNFASGVVGSLSYLTPELFKLMTGVKMVGVPYQGSAPAIVAMLGGQVDMMFVELSTALPHIRGGKLRALAVASEKRSAFLPETRTMAEVLPGFIATVWFGAAAPPKTPTAVADKLSAAIAEIVKQPDAVKHMQDLSLEGVGGTPAELSRFMKEESRRWGQVFRATGASAD